MRRFHFYHAETGLFADLSVCVGGDPSSDEKVRANTPEGHAALEGEFDHLSQRVDVATGAVVDHQPPAPTTDHEWNATTKRWQLKPAVAATQEARRAALAQIVMLEQSQDAAVRDALLGRGTDRLKAIDEQITALRSQL